ncbi:MAG: OmpA family protein [Reyranella sp.]|nr:OmpA family protein [Reyranella sp.]
MKRLGVFVAAGFLFAAAPSFAQTVGSCPRGGGANQPPPARVLFDLGSAQLRADNKPVIAQAAATAKARQVSVICLIGHTDKLGDKAFNEKLARSRAQTVAAQLIRDGVPANHVYIVADPEAFGNMSLGKEDASVVDRKVTIFFSR